MQTVFSLQSDCTPVVFSTWREWYLKSYHGNDKSIFKNVKELKRPWTKTVINSPRGLCIWRNELKWFNPNAYLHLEWNKYGSISLKCESRMLKRNRKEGGSSTMSREQNRDNLMT